MDEADDVVNIDNIEDHLLSCLFLTLGDIGGQALPCWDLSAPDYIQERPLLSLSIKSLT